MSISEAEIIAKVKNIVATSLQLDEKKVELGAALIRDLGAESIDFLDILFRLESTFKIKIAQNELFPERLLTNETFSKNGRVTPLGIQELKRKMPDVDWDEFSKNPTIGNLGNLFTVGMIVSHICKKSGVVSFGGIVN